MPKPDYGITNIYQDEESGESICKKVMAEARVLSIEEYIKRISDTILPFARCRNIYRRCKRPKYLVSNLLS